MQAIDFNESIKKGKIGERIFIDDVLNFLNLKYQDVTNCQSFQIEGTDFMFPLGRVDVKNSYKSSKNEIIIEEHTNYFTKKPGWFYTSKAHMFVFVDSETRKMVWIPNNTELHSWYSENKEKFKLRFNKMSYSYKGNWQSTFRVVDLDYIPHSFYYKPTQKMFTKSESPALSLENAFGL